MIVRGGAIGFVQEIVVGPHRLVADEPITVGGTDTGPNPYDILLASLGSCTSMTVALYARRKQWPLESVTVRLRHAKIHAADCSECETREGMVDRIEVSLELAGSLTEAQKARLLEMAGRCPVSPNADLGDRHSNAPECVVKALSGAAGLLWIRDLTSRRHGCRSRQRR